MSFLETLKSMTISDLIAHVTVIIGILSIFIEKSKKLPFNPWTKLFQWIGSKANEPVYQRLEALDEQDKQTKELIKEIRDDYKEAISSIKEDYNKRIDKLEYEADNKEVKRLRSNIICFADSCRIGTVHTKQHFENIFRDYDDYLAYCKNRDFTNHFIDSEIDYIKSAYTKYSEENRLK